MARRIRYHWRRYSAFVIVSLLIASLSQAVAGEEVAPFTVRGDTAPELLAFIRHAKERRPAGKSREGDIAFLTAQQRSVVAATDRILALALMSPLPLKRGKKSSMPCGSW